MKKENTATRLKLIMKERNLRQVDILEKCRPFCEKWGVKLGRNDLSQYVSGKVEPKQHKLSVLGNALNVSEAWLMGFDVPMERIDNNPEEKAPQIMCFYNHLNTHGKEVATEQVRLLTLDEKYTRNDNILLLNSDSENCTVNAAHRRTDIPESEITPEMIQADEDIMNNF